MKKKISNFLVVWVSFVFVLFLTFSFVNYDMNPEAWGNNGRMIFSVIAFFLMVVAAFIADVVFD